MIGNLFLLTCILGAAVILFVCRRSRVEKAVEAAFQDFVVTSSGRLEPPELGDRPKIALAKFAVTERELARELATNSEPVVFGIGALALWAQDLCADRLEAEMEHRFSGRPLVCGFVMMHLCSSLTEACERGLALLDQGGQLAAVGHVMLCCATLQPVEPGPDSYIDQSNPSFDPHVWDFLRTLKREELTYKTLFIRGLTEAHKDQAVWKESRAIEDIRNLLRIVGKLQPAGDGADGLWVGMKAEDIAPLVKSMKNPITIKDVQAKAGTRLDLVFSYLLASGPGGL